MKSSAAKGKRRIEPMFRRKKGSKGLTLALSQGCRDLSGRQLTAVTAEMRQIYRNRLRWQVTCGLSLWRWFLDTLAVTKVPSS
jgi:hypothetical protein